MHPLRVRGRTTVVAGIQPAAALRSDGGSDCGSGRAYSAGTGPGAAGRMSRFRDCDVRWPRVDIGHRASWGSLTLVPTVDGTVGSLGASGSTGSEGSRGYAFTRNG